MPTYQFVSNMQNNECLRMAEKWKQDGVYTFPCDRSDWGQYFNVNDDTIKDQWGSYLVASRYDDFQKTWPHQGPNSGFDYVRVVPEGDRSSYHKDPYFIFEGLNNGKTSQDAIKNGPFYIRPKVEDNKYAELIDNGETLRLFDGKKAADDRQVFLNLDLWDKCKARGISFKECTSDKLADCTDPRNYNLQDCPKEYCSKKEPAYQNYSKSGGSEWKWGDMYMNFLKDECTPYVKDDKNKFDEIAEEMCSYSANQNGGNERCNCFGEYKSETYDKIKKANPGIVFSQICQSDKCINNNKAYRSKNMLEKPCQSINICLQGIETGSIGGAADLKNINFVCNQDTGKVAAANTPVSIPVSTPLVEEPVSAIFKPRTASNQIDYSPYIIGGSVLILIIILLLILK